MKIVVPVFALALWFGDAAADDVAAASKAFARAQRAMLAGDPGLAADLFELADSLAPSPQALRNAARARYAAGHAAAAATRAAELSRLYDDDASRLLARELLDRLSPSLGQITVRCSAPCAIEIEGRAIAIRKRLEHQLFINPGRAELVAVFAGAVRRHVTVAAGAGETATTRIEAPPVEPAIEPVVKAPPPPPSSPRRGLDRRWVFGATIATAGLGGAAAVFGVLTLRDRDEIRARVAAGDLDAAESMYASAETRQLVTNLLLAGAAVTGVTTLALVFLTDGSGGRDLGLAPTRGGAAITYAGRF